LADSLDVVVIGSGPNGLAAAIRLARAGREVVVFEADPTAGGGVRSSELTLPGFVHDICSAVHPFAVRSVAFDPHALAKYGVEWIEPPSMLAHPFDDGSAAVVDRRIDRTAATLGEDAGPYAELMAWTVRQWPSLGADLLGPPRWPSHPLAAARFGLAALQSASGFARRRFRGPRARALFAGVAAHGMRPLDGTITASFGLVLTTLAHSPGWLFPRGGAQKLADALVAHLRALGGEVVTGRRVASLGDLPPARAIVCDLSPRPFVSLAGSRLPPRYRRALERYRYGMGAFKVDWALGAPIPWTSQGCRHAGTVHLGGTIEEIETSERDAWQGRTTERPFVLLSQPTIADATRAPSGTHVAWAYCHVPPASATDMLPRIEAQIERFAPGFRDIVLARHVMTPSDIERHNPNLVGGDIGAGVTALRQLIARPTLSWYRTPLDGVYLCSAATPPGVGVHGMCGYHAAGAVLRDQRGVAPDAARE
jgi:phytoene dehydrogenase-like protein